MSRKFERALDKATDPTLLEPDWLAVMDTVDLIRSAEVTPKIALPLIFKRVRHENPHVAHHALLVLESAAKNCGDKFHRELATRDCMEALKRLAHDTKAEKVKEKVLELVQCWAHAFRQRSEFKIVVDTHDLMKLEGFQFNALCEADAMFAGHSAPDWADATSCFRCRTAFGMLTRKHHCRACGQVFCSKCSDRYVILPHIGMETEVRVCESCHEKYSAGKTASANSSPDTPRRTLATPALPLGGTTTQRADPEQQGDVTDKHKKRVLEAKEKEDMELAMAISQSEADEKERQRSRMLYNMYNGAEEVKENGGGPDNQAALTNIIGDVVGVKKESDVEPTGEPVDPELARYLNRDYWEKKKEEGGSSRRSSLRRRQSPSPSAPPPAVEQSVTTNGHVDGGVTAVQPINADVKEDEASTIEYAAQIKQQIEMLSNRIRSDQARGRSIVNDSSIQNLFIVLTTSHKQLLQRMSDLDDSRASMESMQDKLSAIGEARQAVDALREEHAKMEQQRLWEEQQRRQVQMMHKLDLMRHQKHQMLEAQRMQALQQFQAAQTEIEQRRQLALQQQQHPVPYGVVPYAVQAPQQQYAPPQMEQPTAATTTYQQQPINGQPVYYGYQPHQYGEQPQQQPPQAQQQPQGQQLLAQHHQPQAHQQQPQAQHHQPQVQQQQSQAPLQQYAAPPSQQPQQQTYAPPQPMTQQQQPLAAPQSQMYQQPPQQQQQQPIYAPQPPTPSAPDVGELISFD